MSLSQFLNSLLHEGRVQVDPIEDRAGRIPADRFELDEATRVLEEFEIDYRKELAYQPPAVSRPALIWSAQLVQRACALLTYREIDAEGVRRSLTDVCPEEPRASVVYSVDLTLRFLPDLTRLARAASADDPLVHRLIEIAQQWPLSSVGIASLSVVGPLDWLGDPCLRQLYVDRILAEQEESRLDDPRVLEAVRAAIGMHPLLAPKLKTRLERMESTDPPAIRPGSL